MQGKRRWSGPTIAEIVDRAEARMRRWSGRRRHRFAPVRSRFEAIAAHSSDALVLVDRRGIISWASPASRLVLGIAPADLVGRRLVTALGSRSTGVLGPVLERLAGQAMGTAVEVTTTADSGGRTRSLEGVATNLLDDPSVEGLLVSLRDVTVRVQAHRELAAQAFADPLTGLANRARFLERVTERLDHLPAGGLPPALLFIDLDDFKAVNDRLGHGPGDDLLVAAANRIAAALGPGDLAGRLGGDEFAVLLDAVDDAGALAVAESILTLLAAPLAVEHGSVTLAASIGIAVPRARSVASTDLLREADVAMYAAKHGGKGRVHLSLGGRAALRRPGFGRRSGSLSEGPGPARLAV